MIKVHCNICDEVIHNPSSEGTMVIVSPWKEGTTFFHIRPLFVKKEDKKELKLTIIEQQKKSIIDTLESGHICECCLLNALSNPKIQVLGK